MILKCSSKFLFAMLVILTNHSIVSGAKLKCEYSSSAWTGYNEPIYYCSVNNNGIFTPARVIIDSVEGIHSTGKTDNNIQGLDLHAIPSVKFFPLNLENIFRNLILINIYSTDLQEIKQNDIKWFTKLKCFRIISCKITTIDEDLFKFNPELRAILLHNNQISQIDPNVFDHLDNLSFLYLANNKCKNALSNIGNSRSAVLKLIQQVNNAECASSDMMQKKKEIQEQMIKARYENCTAEKSTLSNQVIELQDKLREAEKIKQEKVQNYEETIAVLNRNLNELREQSNNQELKKKNENLTNELSLLQRKYEDKLAALETLNERINEWKDKYINLLDTKHTEFVDCNNKYTALLHAKLIESENKVNSVILIN